MLLEDSECLLQIHARLAHDVHFRSTPAKHGLLRASDVCEVVKSTMRAGPAVKKSQSGLSSSLEATATLAGFSGSPSAWRSPRSNADLTVSFGSSSCSVSAADHDRLGFRPQLIDALLIPP